MSNEVFYDSPEAAQQVTVTCWKSRTGALFDSEETARNDGATHRKCESCKSAIAKTQFYCEGCQKRQAVERQLARDSAIRELRVADVSLATARAEWLRDPQSQFPPNPAQYAAAALEAIIAADCTAPDKACPRCGNRH